MVKIVARLRNAARPQKPPQADVFGSERRLLLYAQGEQT